MSEFAEALHAAAIAFRDFCRVAIGRCTIDGAEHCEHFDYKRGAVSFFRCCKCKERTSFSFDPE